MFHQVWRTLETLRSQLNNNSTSNSTLNDKCICLEAFLDQIELCQETERGALITSLASGRFWIQFCENYLENKEKSEEHLLSCSSLFELLIRYKCVLLLGIKLVGFQKFKQLFYSIFDMEMTRVGLLLRTAQYVFILVDELYWSLRRILLIVLHLIRTLFDINDLSHSRRLQELNITIALQQLFTMLGQDKTGLVEDCLEDHEELLWACVRLINVTICITLQRPKMFFEQKGLLESFLVFVAMVSRVQLQKFSYDLPNTTQITYLRVLRKREKEEEEEEQQQQQKQKQKQQQPKGQEQNENKANAKIDNSSSLQLSNFYSSLTQSLMSCSSDISDDSMRHLARFILTLTLFLRVFESSMKSSLSENTKCLALVLKDLLCLIIRYEVLNFWNGQNRSKTSAVYIVTKIVALKELLNWVCFLGSIYILLIHFLVFIFLPFFCYFFLNIMFCLCLILLFFGRLKILMKQNSMNRHVHG